MAAFADAFNLLLDPFVLLIIFLSAAGGVILGAIPGLTATMGIVLLIPFIFYMDPVPGIAAIVSLTATAIFAGDIPGALLRIPGTPASAAYTDEAYAMTRKGQVELALGISLVTASAGGMIGAIVLLALAPPLADFAVRFSSFEYFWLACLGLVASIIITTDDRVKGFISLFIGITIGSIGIDPVTGVNRFTGDIPVLAGGLGIVPVLVGLYAVSETIRGYSRAEFHTPPPSHQIKKVFSGVGTTILRYWRSFVQGNLLGSFLGALPGAGADIAAWISYALSKRFSRSKEKFGTGHPEGLVAAGAANNSAISSAYVPMMVFGIPGDSLTAIVIGVLFVKGLNPGPTIFLNEPGIVYAIIFSFFLANLIMLPLGYLAIRGARHLVKVPRSIMLPMVLLFSAIAAFASTNMVFAIGVLFAMGVLGWLMEENGVPVAPAVLGLILAPLIEQNFLRSLMISRGSILPFFERPIAGVLAALTITALLLPIGTWLWSIVRNSRENKASGS